MKTLHIERSFAQVSVVHSTFFYSSVSTARAITRLMLSFALTIIFMVALFALRPLQSFSQSEQLKTKYPVVMVHGILGFDTLFKNFPRGTKGFDYFYNIADTLSEQGTTIYFATTPSSSSNAQLGEALLRQIREILLKEGTTKVHLIGHSQGGLAARYVLSHAPEVLASITTIASPHMGAAIPDLILSDRINQSPFLKSIVFKLFDLMGLTLEKLSGNQNPQNSAGALYDLSSTGAAAYNQKYPAGLPPRWESDPCDLEGIQHTYQGVHLYSWNAIRPYDFHNFLDQPDYLLYWGSHIFTFMNNRDGEQNDGLVGKCSMYFGEVINAQPYIQNHAEEINLSVRSILGLPPAAGRTDPIPLYISHIKRLQAIE
ncbi:MAG: alpha/beta fold hydrolase [Oligoflexia bacterium]|nr:alpha/beta fold hydrolase [Oligoflexia bacterium]